MPLRKKRDFSSPYVTQGSALFSVRRRSLSIFLVPRLSSLWQAGFPHLLDAWLFRTKPARLAITYETQGRGKMHAHIAIRKKLAAKL